MDTNSPLINEKILAFDVDIEMCFRWFLDNKPPSYIGWLVSRAILDKFSDKIDIPKLSFDSLSVDADNPKSFLVSKDRHNVKAKVGKILREIIWSISPKLWEKISGREFEIYVNEFIARLEYQIESKDLKYKNSLLSLEIVYGQRIYDYYKISKTGSVGELSKSCMSGKPKETFQIYTQNPDKVGLVVLTYSGQLIARALLWKLDKGSKWNYFLDRIYAEHPRDAGRLVHELKEKLGTNNILLHSDLKSEEGTKIKTGIKIYLDHTFFKTYPYLDTFFYLHIPFKVLDSPGIIKKFQNFLTSNPNFKTVELVDGGFISDKTYPSKQHLIFELQHWISGIRIRSDYNRVRIRLVDYETGCYQIG